MVAPTQADYDRLKQNLDSFNTLINGNETEDVVAPGGAVYPTERKHQKILSDKVDLQIATLPSGRKGYATLALAQAAQSTLAANTLVEVTNDTTTANNGVYLWNGTTLTKSTYDPLMQAKADATTKANAAEANAKTYADTNKIDVKQLTVEYKDGNMIGAKSLKLIGTGLSLGRVIISNADLDSVIIPVVAGDVLYIHNNLSTYTTSLSDTYAFFAENPAQNTAQTRIPAVGSNTITDPVTAIKYMAVTVPENAKFLMLNIRNGATATQWAVRKGTWIPSYTQGDEILSKVKDIPLYSPPNIFENTPKVSAKNLYKGTVLRKFRVNDNGVYVSADNNAAVIAPIPVVFGQSYTISGIPRKPMGTTRTRILGLENNSIPTSGFVKLLATTANDSVTVTIDDSRIKYIVFPLSKEAPDEIIDLEHIPLQVEAGNVKTSYEPYYHTDALLRAMAAKGDSAPVGPQPLKTRQIVSQFNELNAVRDPNYVNLVTMSKDISPIGISYSVSDSSDSSSNNLYAKVDAELVGNKSIYAYLMKTLNDVEQIGVLKHTPFTTPSGSLDNPGSFAYANKYPNYLTVHPSIAYTKTPIAGFKYWMVSSTFPPTSDGGVKWEDEDLFVSNDAVNWQRVRSMYETDKSYTTATLRLPPQTLVTSGARRNAFLPSPVVGDTFEVSVPAISGMPAVDRQTYTVSSNLPWKHDPDLIIDGGYIYVYHSFNIFFNERNDKKSHFFVCVRTNNGIDWDFVRADGSTLRITEETSKQVFTKGADGKYNYLSYAYDDSRSNPEVVKFGEGDYELFYGRNFTQRFHGTTPYNFDFNSPVTVKDLSNMNHPTLIYNNGVLYNLSNYYCHTSTDRGATWTQLPHYPLWRGGVGGFNYKKSSCIGEGGKFIVADVVRVSAQAYEVSYRAVSNDINTMNLFEFSSFSDFLDKANNGLVDAYIDIQITKVNLDTASRTVINLPNISLKDASLTGPLVLERLKIAELELSTGDVIHFNVTLNSRNGAKITFGGLEVS